MNKIDKIPTKKILKDIKDTEEEIEDYTKINKILEKHPSENKVKLFMNRARISKRREFIKKLNNILKERKNNEK